MTIVAFYSQQSESGKDTATGFALEWAAEQGLAARRVSFADEMKIVCAKALGFDGTREQMIQYIDLMKLHGEVRSMAIPPVGHPLVGRTAFHYQNGRDFIIGLAEGVRDLDRGFWTRVALDFKEPLDLPVVSDLRFHEEADVTLAAGGQIIEIHRPGAPTYNEDRLPENQIYRRIVNDDTLDVLRENVRAAVAAAYEGVI